jgi:hypothetical protein
MVPPEALVGSSFEIGPFAIIYLQTPVVKWCFMIQKKKFSYIIMQMYIGFQKNKYVIFKSIFKCIFKNIEFF